MKDLYIKAFGGLFGLIIAMGAMLFLSSWTFDYWQAWVFLAVFSVMVTAITLYLVKKDPKLLERRVNAGPGAEKESSQKIIQFFAQLGFIATIVVPSLDHRFAWSAPQTLYIIVGDFLVVFGLLAVFFVFRENSFTSAIIEVGADQKVVSTGPYAIVRHPMYAGAFIMIVGVPLALGSYWGLAAVAFLMLAIVWRLLDEENFLKQKLPGYVEYTNKVKYRLIPFVW